MRAAPDVDERDLTYLQDIKTGLLKLAENLQVVVQEVDHFREVIGKHEEEQTKDKSVGDNYKFVKAVTLEELIKKQRSDERIQC